MATGNSKAEQANENVSIFNSDDTIQTVLSEILIYFLSFTLDLLLIVLKVRNDDLVWKDFGLCGKFEKA